MSNKPLTSPDALARIIALYTLTPATQAKVDALKAAKTPAESKAALDVITRDLRTAYDHQLGRTKIAFACSLLPRIGERAARFTATAWGGEDALMAALAGANAAWTHVMGPRYDVSHRPLREGIEASTNLLDAMQDPTWDHLFSFATDAPRWFGKTGDDSHHAAWS